VQLDPIQPTLKAPGTNLLTLEFDEPLSNFALNFNFRCYNEELLKLRKKTTTTVQAGVYFRPLFSST